MESAFKIVKLDKRRLDLYTYLTNNNVSSKYALKATEYTSQQLARYLDIYDDFFYPDYIKDELSRFDDKKYSRFELLMEKESTPFYAFEASKLDDKKYESTLNLYNNGIELRRAVDIVVDDVILKAVNEKIEAGDDLEMINAYLQKSTFEEIRKRIKKEDFDTILADLALRKISENIIDYFESLARISTSNNKIVSGIKNNSVKYVASDNGTKVNVELFYDKKGCLENVSCTNDFSNPTLLNLSFENGTLTSFDYVDDEYFSKIDIKSSKFVQLVGKNHQKFLRTLLHLNYYSVWSDQDFETLKNILWGDKNWILETYIGFFNSKYPDIELVVDNNLDADYIDWLIEILDEQPKEDIPKKIVVTTFLPDGCAGVFRRENEIRALSRLSHEGYKTSVLHELHHWKDYFTGEKLGQTQAGEALVFNNKILSDSNGKVLDGVAKYEGAKILFKNV